MTALDRFATTRFDPWHTAPAESPDAVIVLLAEQAIELWRKIPSLDTDEATNRAADEVDGLVSQVMERPAWTPAGALAKFRLHLEMVARWRGVGDVDELDRAHKSLLSDIERLAGKVAL